MQGLWKSTQKSFYKDKRGFYSNRNKERFFKTENSVKIVPAESVKHIEALPVYSYMRRVTTFELKGKTKTQLVVRHPTRGYTDYYTGQPILKASGSTLITAGLKPCEPFDLVSYDRYYPLYFRNSKQYLGGIRVDTLYPSIPRKSRRRGMSKRHRKKYRNRQVRIEGKRISYLYLANTHVY